MAVKKSSTKKKTTSKKKTAGKSSSSGSRTISKKKTSASSNTVRQPGAKYKATREIVEARVMEVSELILSGHEDKIVQYCAQKFQIGRRQAYKYKKAAIRRIQRLNARSLDEARNIQIAKMNRIIIKAEKEKNFFTALQAHKEVHRLLGLYKDSLTINKGSSVSDMTDEELEAELESLKEAKEKYEQFSEIEKI